MSTYTLGLIFNYMVTLGHMDKGQKSQVWLKFLERGGVTPML